MDIKGAEHLSPQEFAMELQRGGRVVEFSYCVSLLVVTLRRSAVVFVRPGESTLSAAMPYLLLSLFLGWWGFPFGLIFTPIAIFQNLSGGTDHTARFAAQMPRAPSPPMQAFQSPPPSTLVRVYAPDGTSYPATPLGQDGALVRVRFLDGREEWVPAERVRAQ
jgi:hypothetical protein